MIFEMTTMFLLNRTEMQDKDRILSERVLMALLLCDLPCFFLKYFFLADYHVFTVSLIISNYLITMNTCNY